MHLGNQLDKIVLSFYPTLTLTMYILMFFISYNTRDIFMKFKAKKNPSVRALGFKLIPIFAKFYYNKFFLFLIDYVYFLLDFIHESDPSKITEDRREFYSYKRAVDKELIILGRLKNYVCYNKAHTDLINQHYRSAIPELSRTTYVQKTSSLSRFLLSFRLGGLRNYIDTLKATNEMKRDIRIIKGIIEVFFKDIDTNNTNVVKYVDKLMTVIEDNNKSLFNMIFNK